MFPTRRSSDGSTSVLCWPRSLSVKPTAQLRNPLLLSARIVSVRVLNRLR